MIGQRSGRRGPSNTRTAQRRPGRADDEVGQAEDLGGAAVVAHQPHEPSLRVAAAEGQQVLRGGSREGVDPSLLHI